MDQPMPSYTQLLRPQVLTEVLAQVVNEDTLLQTFGMQIGGARERNMGHGRHGTYHVVDDNRGVALTRSPASGQGTSSKTPTKAVDFVYPRMGDSVFLEAEFFNNLGKITEPAIRDAAGRDQIMMQTEKLGQKGRNWRKVMLCGLLKDTLYVHEDGDDWHLSYTSSNALFRIQSQIPSGNKSQLHMLDRAGNAISGISSSIIDAPWSNANTNIADHFAKIDKARSAQGVGPVTDVFLNGVTWRYLTGNDTMHQEVGIAVSTFKMFERQTGVRADGSPLHEQVGSFTNLPGKIFHITDQGADIYNGSSAVWTPDFADGEVLMTGNPLGGKYSMYIGGEPVSEYEGQPETERFGFYAWSYKQPHGVGRTTGTNLFVQDNALAVMHDPYDIQFATVTGF